MTITQLFASTNAQFRGTDDDPPTTGTDFSNWLVVTNRLQDQFCRDPKNQWSSLWSTDTLSPVVAAGTQTYNLPATFLLPSDRVKVTVGTNVYYYVICKPQETDRYENACYISDSNPRTLTFVDTITSSSQIVGGTITIPGYHLLPDFTAGSDTVLVDDPYWLSTALAAALAGNDITYSDKAPDLQNQANQLYSHMALANKKGTANNPRTVRTNVNRILSPRSEAGTGTM